MDLSEILQELADALGISVYQDICTNEGLTTYITYVYQDERPVLAGDNEVLADKCELYINLYTPPQFDYFDLKKQIRDYLEKKEFVINSINTAIEDTDITIKRIRRTSFDVEFAIFR